MILLSMALTVPALAESIIYSNGNLKVPVQGNQAPSVVSGGGFIATGPAAEIIAGGNRRPFPAQPAVAQNESTEAHPKPTDFELINANGRPIAGMYEIVPGAIVLSRHALRGNSELAARLERFEVFEFLSVKDQKLDVLLAIGKGIQIEAIVERKKEGGCHCGVREYQLRKRPEFARALSLDQEFYSRHLSTVGDAPVLRQLRGRIGSLGAAMSIEEARFVDAFLDADTGPGSSGAVISVKDGNRWKVGGVIACYMKPVQLQGKGHQTHAGTKIITMRAMINSTLRQVRPEEIVIESEQFGGCSPIDNRAGGGF